MISVIVPIYNTEKYLPQCLDSILNQTFKDLEVICVNDGSPGNCLQILEAYRANDARIKIVDKQNEGLEAARISGFQASSGNYIMHVDSDDWLEGTDTLEFMYNTLIEKNADYIEIGHQRVMDRHGWIKKKGWGSVFGIIEQPQLFDDYYVSYFGYNKLNVNIWGKLYRRSVVEKANPKPLGITMGEDLTYNIQIFPHLNRIYILDRVGYNYRFGGMTSRYNSRLLRDIKKEFLLKESLIEKYQYEKARRFACIEMKNVLKSDICQQIIFKVGDEKAIVSRISEELSDSLWSRVLATEIWKDDTDPFVMAMMHKDSATLFAICQKEVKQDKAKRMIKKLISFICQNL